MTVTLSPEIEARFRTYAENMGYDPDQLANAFLTRDLEEAEAELQETMEGLDRSAEDFAAGRWITGEELDRQLEALAVAARARRNGSRPQETETVKKAKVGEAALAQ